MWSCAIIPPPSVNNLYFNLPRGGRAPSGQYKAWKKEAGATIAALRQAGVPGPVVIRIWPPQNGRRDLDGYAKATIDLLVSHRIIESDRCKTVRGIDMRWATGTDLMQVRVAPCQT